MVKDYQTKIRSGDRMHSAEKVRRLGVDRLSIPLPEDESSNDVSWEALREKAVDRARGREGNTRSCAVLTQTGNVYIGHEIRTDSEIIHSLRVAILTAVGQNEPNVEKAFLYNKRGEICGGCRQLLADFSSGTTEVRISGEDGVVKQYSIENLLPDSG
jgi:LSD1 subclass zinc finger protein